MKRIHRGMALALSAVLLLLTAAPSAWAAENTITIETAQDLAELSKNCSLDSWSQGKTVLLAGDIDLTGTDFRPIPTFGGTFDGQGHTISGLLVTGNGNVQGLFRYVQVGGVVQDLSVRGTVSPTDFRDTAGGIVGSNRGQLLRCTFQGTVKGESSVGGIAGINEAEGRLINCTFSGLVEGNLHVGGIAGQNLGGVIQCTNQGDINPTSETPAKSEDPLNLGEQVAGWTDVGGIAGYSTGLLQSCRNEGAVGYPHIGYNVGGIAGRQSGCLDGCVNTGKVMGRKDIGGVAGQMEPDVTLLFNESFLQRLGDELSTLQNMSDALLDDVGVIADDLSAQMQAISDQTRLTKDAVGDLSDAMTAWADEGIGQVNDLSARISRTLDQLEPVLDDVDGQLKDLSDVVEDLSGALDRAEEMGQLGEESIRSLRLAMEELRKIPEACRGALAKLQEAVKALRDALGDEEKTQEALKQCVSAAEELAEVILGRAGAAADHLLESLRALAQGGDEASGILSRLSRLGEELSALMDDMADSASELHQVLKDLSDQPAISFPSLDSAITEERDALDEAFSSLMDQADGLHTLADSSVDTVTADLKAISGQLGVISSLLSDEGARMQETDLEDRFQDVSDREQIESQTTGRLSSSRNEGAVEGDVNVAGIAGSLAIDLEYDPEDDWNQAGDHTLDVWVETRAVLFRCVNTGLVTGKKDYAGGIVGRMDMGRVQNCENYGDVASTDGSYVGGIAGASWGTVHSCWSKCTLSGTHYIGGIAGLGSDLTECRTLVEIAEGGAYTGAVAGSIETDGTVSGNLFASEDLAAIDGISYAGSAEPVTLEALCLLPDVPADFSKLTLTFTADDELVGIVSVPYGEGIDVLPELPAKEGYSAAWPDLDYRHITASQTVEAVYTPYTSALSGSGELPRILVDGSFSSRAKVAYAREEVCWTDQGGTQYSGTAWTVTVDDPDLKTVSYTIHYRLPEEGGRWSVWVQGENGWESQEYTVDGHYLLLAGNSETTTFCVLPRELPVVQIILAVIALAAVLLFALIRRRRKTQRHQAQPSDKSLLKDREDH